MQSQKLQLPVIDLPVHGQASQYFSMIGEEAHEPLCLAEELVKTDRCYERESLFFWGCNP